MGLAGAPHCAAMCGPACAAVLGACEVPGRRSPGVFFHLARIAGYAAAGALTAAGVGLLAWAGQGFALIRPLWSLLHMAALALGLWLAITGRQPAWLTRIGATRRGEVASGASGASGNPVTLVGPGAGARALVRAPWSAAGAGAAWVAWPCGLLQSALVVAGLANTPAAGALAMAAFAVSSATGLQLAPWLWRRWTGPQGGPTGSVDLSRWMVRLAGALLAAGSAWALGQDIWGKVWHYCFG